MKIVAGEGKKESEFWAVRRSPVEGESGEVVRRRESRGERPNLGRTHENLEHTPHRHNTTHQQQIPHRVVLGKGGPAQRRSMAQKTRHEQHIVPNSSPTGQGFFWGQGWFAKVKAQNGLIKKSGLGQKLSGSKVVWAKSGAGQKWSEKKLKKKSLSPSPKTKNKITKK